MRDDRITDTSITRQIEISLIADSAFQAQEPDDPTAAMLTRLNIVEGVFSEQVGLLVLATDVRLMPANADPFTSTKGPTLLDQLGAYRKATPSVRARNTMTGPGRPSSRRNQVILDGQRFEPYARTGTRAAAGGASRAASQSSRSFPATDQPVNVEGSGRSRRMVASVPPSS